MVIILRLRVDNWAPFPYVFARRYRSTERVFATECCGALGCYSKTTRLYC